LSKTTTVQIITEGEPKMVELLEYPTDKSTIHVVPYGESWSPHDFTTKKELTLAELGWGRMPEHLIAPELTAGLPRLNVY
jgi:hypothetical protein